MSQTRTLATVPRSANWWWPWALRVVWLTLPFLAGPLFGDALDGTSRPLQVTATIGLWVV